MYEKKETVMSKLTHVHASVLIIFRERLMHLPFDFIFDRVMALA